MILTFSSMQQIFNACLALPGADGMVGNGKDLIPALTGLRFLEGEADSK